MTGKELLAQIAKEAEALGYHDNEVDEIVAIALLRFVGVMISGDIIAIADLDEALERTASHAKKHLGMTTTINPGRNARLN
jgi:hypothetical protein